MIGKAHGLLKNNIKKMAKKNRYLQQAFLEMQKTKPNLKAAFDLLKLSAESNNYEALYAIGTWYLHGRYVKKNAATAVSYFLESIKGNNSNAFYDLALCYEKGVGAKRNVKRAFECYLNAALLGDKQSLYEVGRCYYYGIGIAKNQNVGLIWLKYAESKGITE